MRECFHHGGRVGAAQRAFPDAPSPWVDLSTGLNPVAYPAAGEPIDWAPLPDPEQLVALEHAAAMAFRLEGLGSCAVPGTEIGLRLLALLDLPRPVRIVSPAYGSYGDAWPDALAIAATDLDRAAAERGTLVLANPNNPDGRLRSAAEMVHLANRAAAAGGMLIVDEAFADATPEASLLPHLRRLDPAHVVVLRSFGKFYGLGGLRLGFVICDDARAASLRRLLGSWPLSSAAIAIGLAAYRDHGWAAATRRRLGSDAERLDALLARHGLAAGGNCPLFRLVERDDATDLFKALCRQAILTRPFGYAPNWLRFGLPGAEAEWEQLDAALARTRA